MRELALPGLLSPRYVFALLLRQATLTNAIPSQVLRCCRNWRLGPSVPVTETRIGLDSALAPWPGTFARSARLRWRRGLARPSARQSSRHSASKVTVYPSTLRSGRIPACFAAPAADFCRVLTRQISPSSSSQRVVWIYPSCLMIPGFASLSPASSSCTLDLFTSSSSNGVGCASDVAFIQGGRLLLFFYTACALSATV